MSTPQDVLQPKVGEKRLHSDVSSRSDSTGSASQYGSFALPTLNLTLTLCDKG